MGILNTSYAKEYDVFVPIAKYIREGDAKKLSAWFADNLELSILGKANDCSDKQAQQIMKSFFNTYTPRSFDIKHKAGSSNKKYAIGNLKAGGKVFLVTIFVNFCKDEYQIQHIKIELLQ